MRVVFAPDSFKGTITAADAAAALAEGWAMVDPTLDAVLRPMADGGEGTVAAFAAAVPGAVVMPITVTGPAGTPVPSAWLLLPATGGAPRATAVIDLASTSGIELLGDAREPWTADTTGFGQAIVAALDHGVSRLILGIGSSASTDAGTGLLSALGARFLTVDGTDIARGARGLLELDAVDRGGLRPAPEVLVLTDVTNPLVGPKGAARIFGPQKGLTDDADIDRVDAAIAHLATLLDLDVTIPGAGAAGGAGSALISWGARLAPGSAEVSELIGLADALAGADLVVTGEGSYDGQSGDGKVPSHVAGLAASAGIRSMVAAGRITDDADLTLFSASASLTDLAGSAALALAQPARYLREAGSALARATLTP